MIEKPDKISSGEEITEVSTLQGIAGSDKLNFTGIPVTSATTPIANTLTELRDSAEGSTQYCHTALATKLSHVNEIGKETSFTKQGEAFVYDLGNPDSRNVFRLQVSTISGNADGNDFEHKGRGDRVYVKMYQSNIHYVTSLMMKVLEESDTPLFLMENEDLLMQKIAPLVDDDKLLSLVYSEEVRTDSDGYLSKDIIIPDDWLPTPIFLTVGYGYDRREEISAGEKQQAAMQMWTELVLEVLVFSLVCALMPPLCIGFGPGKTLALKGLGILGVAEIAYAVAQISDKMPLGGENNYGCWFGEGPLLHTYGINYKSDIGDIMGKLSGSQQDFLKMLEDEKKQQDKNAQLLGGAIVAAIVIGFGAAAMFGGK